MLRTPQVPDAHRKPPDEPESPTRPRARYIPWAQLLKRTFALDVETCPSCQGRMKLVALVPDPKAVALFLRHLGEPAEPPPLAPFAYAPTEARAFCRTTTVQVPAGYDPTSRGCIAAGVPLAWPAMPVTYELQADASSQVSFADATPILDRSFAKWAAASCSATDASKHPALSFRNGGATDAGYAPWRRRPMWVAAGRAPHVIIFRDQGWPYNDPNNTLALTTVTFGVDTGTVLAADMEINTKEHPISTVVPPPMGAFSLEAIVTHEAGHFIGVAHSQIDTAVMFAHYQPDAIALTTDDIAAVCEVYPPANPPKAGCSCSTTGGKDGTTTLAGASLALALSRRRQRQRHESSSAFPTRSPCGERDPRAAGSGSVSSDAGTPNSSVARTSLGSASVGPRLPRRGRTGLHRALPTRTRTRRRPATYCRVNSKTTSEACAGEAD